MTHISIEPGLFGAGRVKAVPAWREALRKGGSAVTETAGRIDLGTRRRARPGAGLLGVGYALAGGLAIVVLGVYGVSNFTFTDGRIETRVMELPVAAISEPAVPVPTLSEGRDLAAAKPSEPELNVTLDKGLARGASGSENAPTFDFGGSRNISTLPLLPVAEGETTIDSTGVPLSSAAVEARQRALKYVPAWRRYAVPTPVIDGRPIVGILIDDVGADPEIFKELMTIDAPVTLSMFAFAKNVQVMAAEARDKGFELMVHIPMEPEQPLDPGPSAISADYGRTENIRRFNWHLDQFDGYVGFDNHMGSRSTTDPEVMLVAMRVMEERGLLFIDQRSSIDSKAGALARRLSLPTADRDVYLNDRGEDGSAPLPDINIQLQTLETKAEKYGQSLAVVHPTPEAIARLKDWITDARARGYVIAPVTTVVKAIQARSPGG